MNQISHATMSEFYANSEYAQFPHETRIPDDLPIELIKAHQTAHSFVDAAVPQLVLVASLSSDMPFRWDLGDGFTSEQRMRSGDMNLCPPDTEIGYDAENNCLDDHGRKGEARR